MKRSQRSVRTFPRRHIWVTCFLNLPLSSLKFTVHIAAVIVASEVFACLCVRCESSRKREKDVGVHCRFTCWPDYAFSTCEELNADITFSFSLWMCVSISIHTAGPQSHVMSSGSPVPLHKHKSLCARGDFIPEEMCCHLLCKGKITIVENMTAPSTAPSLLSTALDQSFKLNP